VRQVLSGGKNSNGLLRLGRLEAWQQWRLPASSPQCHAQNMKKRMLLAAAIVLVLAGSLACVAQDRGYWRAASTNANAITGDIGISDTKVSINFVKFLIERVRSLHTTEVAAAFGADVNGSDTGALYHLNVPAGRRFLHHSTLCGSEDTQWMATYVSGRTLQVAFFSGSDAPVFTMDALANSVDLCGRYTYVR
jgi:hypothetical protein